MDRVDDQVQELTRAARWLFENGHLEEAADRLRALMETEPLDPQWYNDLGVVHHSLGNTDLARTLFSDALALQGDYADALFNLESLNENCPPGTLQQVRQLTPEGKDASPWFPEIPLPADERIPLRAETYHWDETVRFQANVDAAREHLDRGDHRKAVVFLQRALLVSRFQDEEVLDAYVQVCKTLREYDALRVAYQRAGIEALRRGQLNRAFLYCDWAVNAHYYSHHKYDSVIDHEISERIIQSAEDHPIRARLRSKIAPRSGERIKIGYVLGGLGYDVSITRVYLGVLRHHRKEIFDVTVYSLYRDDDLFLPDAASYQKTSAVIGNLEHRIALAPKLNSTAQRVLCLAERIVDDRIDVIVSPMMYTMPSLHFLHALKLAPAFIKDSFQMREMSLLPDLTIHPTKRAVIEDIGRCIPLMVGMEPPEPREPVRRKDLGLSPDGTVLISVGRPCKFSQDLFWKTMMDLLQRYPQATLCIVGTGPESIDSSSLRTDIRERIKPLGQVKEVEPYLNAADIYVDTFPLGGGLTLIEAMFAGLPIVMFETNYTEPFDIQSNTLSEVVAPSEFVIPRWDTGAFVSAVGRLIENETYRKETGKKSRRTAMERFADVGGYTRKREDLYLRTLLHKIESDAFWGGIYRDKMEFLRGLF